MLLLWSLSWLLSVSILIIKLSRGLTSSTDNKSQCQSQCALLTEPAYYYVLQSSVLVENSNQLLFTQNYHQNASRSADVSEGLLHLGLTKFTDLTTFCSFLVSHVIEVTV